MTGEHEILGQRSNTHKFFDQFCRSNAEKITKDLDILVSSIDDSCLQYLESIKDIAYK
jgi:hypothetical protein